MNKTFSYLNNVPVSKMVIDKFENIIRNISVKNIYNYPDENIIYNILQNFFGIKQENIYIHHGVDNIISELFSLYSNKKIWFHHPNYKMLYIHSKNKNLQIVNNIQDADIIYNVYPNGINGKAEYFDNTNIIWDLSYTPYFLDSTKLIKFINNEYQKGNIILLGASKWLGLPSIRFGVAIGKNINQIKKNKSPYQITGITQKIIENMWNIKFLTKHFKIISDSKKFFESKYKTLPEYNGPIILFKKPNKFTKIICGYNRMSVIDKQLIKE